MADDPLAQDPIRLFEAWFAELQRLAARRADQIPDPPTFPEPPPDLLRALEERPPPIEVPVDFELRVAPRSSAALDALALGDIEVQVPQLDVNHPLNIANRDRLDRNDSFS